MKKLFAAALLLSLAGSAFAQGPTLCSVSTAAPTYVDGQTRPLSCDTSGRLRTLNGAPAVAPGAPVNSLQYNNAGTFGGISGWTTNGIGTITANLGSITTNVVALNIIGTFNNAGVAFDAPLLMDILNTASGAASLLFDFKTNGATRGSLSASGIMSATSFNASTSGFNLTGVGGNGLKTVNGGFFIFTGNGVAHLSDTSDADFGRLQFGGQTAAYPSEKRSGTTLQARLADDSGFASYQGKLTTETNFTATPIVPTGFLTLYDATGTAYKVSACPASGC